MQIGNCYAAVGIGLEELAAQELQSLNIKDVKVTQAGVSFRASWEEALEALLWLRIPSRLLWEIASFKAKDTDELYKEASRIPWEEIIKDDATLAISVSKHKSPVEHTQYAIHRLKDAIVDRLREKTGRRPDIDRENPDLTLHLHMASDTMTIHIDLSGGAMHQRGLRNGQHEAPIKENLAAAMLYRARWPELAAQGYNFIDPLCGSGTIVFEALMMAANIAPGLYRSRMGFAGWQQADMAVWEERLAAAKQQVRVPKGHFWGSDSSEQTISWARKSLEILGFIDQVTFSTMPLEKLLYKDVCGQSPALLATNPPYGRRLGHDEDLTPLYKHLGELLQKHEKWNGVIITEQEELGWSIGLNASKSNHVFNGANPCLVLHFFANDRQNGKLRQEKHTMEKPLTEGAQMVANRLNKNLKELRKWAKKEGVSCYRIYDADMPEYAAAIDLYEEQHAVVWEYAAPKSVDEAAAAKRLNELLAAVRSVTGLPAEKVHLKQRRHLKGGQARVEQHYNGEPDYFQMHEGGAKLLVNFEDYLDTGIFLDHRQVRQEIARLAAGKRLINLFCYTATASVQAAIAGARSSISVDTSATYLKWGRRNMNLNLIDPQHHELIRDDCLRWLDETKDVGDVILVDVPTFSNSKSRESTFDVQRDHVALLTKVLNHLAPGGHIIFSCNYRQFAFDEAAVAALGLKLEEITARTVPFDFRRRPGIHRAWLLSDEEQ